MNRKKFLATGLLAGIGLKPLVAQSEPDKPFVVGTGLARPDGHWELRGAIYNNLDLKVSSKDTNGQLLILEQSAGPKAGPGMHIHFNQDEVFYVMEGEYHFQVGDIKQTLKAGETIFLPRNVAHGWIQVSQKGKMMITFQPAGKMESFLQKWLI